MNWKRTVGQKLRWMTAEQARTHLTRIRAHGITIDQPAVRELTGGYASQNINFYVCRKLGEKAGVAFNNK